MSNYRYEDTQSPPQQQEINCGASPSIPRSQPPLYNNIPTLNQSFAPPPNASIYYYPIYDPNIAPKKKNKTNKNSTATTTIDYSSDYCYSVTFLVLGIFTFFPLFINIMYLRSPNSIAKKCALASVIYGSVVAITITVLYSIAFLDPRITYLMENY